MRYCILKIMKLMFDGKYNGPWWMTTALIVVMSLSGFSRGKPQTSWAPGWGQLIDADAPPSSTVRTADTNKSKSKWAPGWGELIDHDPDDAKPETESTKNVENSTPPTSNNKNLRPSEVACQEWKLLDPAALVPHILGGEKATAGLFPHVGALMGNVPGGAKGFVVLCGSSLIAKRFILTAAHCVSDPLNIPLFVRFGVVNWRNSEDIAPLDVEFRNRPYIHDDYRGFTGSPHDIAIIELKEEVNFTTTIKPACLYTDLGDISSSKPLVVTGWGYTDVDTRALSDELLMTNITTVPLSQCNVTYSQSHVSSKVKKLVEGQYCANDPELVKDACTVDSGGPLQLYENNIATIVGIVSFGQSCASILPSVFTRVAFYLNWIEGIVWPQ